jgi:hypothetical protein
VPGDLLNNGSEQLAALARVYGFEVLSALSDEPQPIGEDASRPPSESQG